MIKPSLQVISPTKSHVLQADTDEMAKHWISSLQHGISTALHETMMAEEASSTAGSGGAAAAVANEDNSAAAAGGEG